MQIYIDSDCKCYASNAEGLTAVETDAFDGKCDTWIEGYRFVPSGQTWTREDGKVFHGEMVAPWMDLSILQAAQSEYEAAQDTIAELDAALLDAEYQNLIGGLEV